MRVPRMAYICHLDIFDSFGDDLVGGIEVGHGFDGIENTSDERESTPTIFHLNSKRGRMIGTC